MVWVLSAMETYRKEICIGRNSGKMAKGSGIKERKNLIDVVPHVYNPNTSKEKAGGSALSTGDTQKKKILIRKQKQKGKPREAGLEANGC